MSTNRCIYPIGDQSFESIRNGGFLYVDKTEYIEKIVTADKYYFLARPRRFGKSLFLSTLKCFFEGKRELFEGLYVDKMEWDWEKHPVIHLDLNQERFQDTELLRDVLLNHVQKWEKEYGVNPQVESLSSRFGNIIEAIHEKTHKLVVVLVDEYDKPLVNNLYNREVFEANRNLLASIYANFKSQADHLRLVFLTGVSRFSKLNQFSDLNNIRNISISDEFAAICGITEQELLDNFQIGIREFANYEEISEGELLEELKRHYDGYHFCRRCPDIYNPYSLLNAMAEKDLGNYWIETGTPKLLVDQLKRFNLNVEDVIDSEASATDLGGLDLDSENLVPLFFQTGYITIKDYDRSSRLYSLGYPNVEVKRGLIDYVLPRYANLGGKSSAVFINHFRQELERGDVEGFMTRLKTMFAGTSYDLHLENENNLQCILYGLVTLLGIDIQAERRTSKGRIDLFFGTKQYLYIIELKFNGTAQEALDQINNRDYAMPFRLDGRQIIKVGANFSTTDRTILDWKVE